MIVYILFNPVDNLCLRTLVKGTLRRVEHLLHDMLFTAGKDEIDIRNKLYIRTNQRNLSPDIPQSVGIRQWRYSTAFRMIAGSRISP